MYGVSVIAPLLCVLSGPLQTQSSEGRKNKTLADGPLVLISKNVKLLGEARFFHRWTTGSQWHLNRFIFSTQRLGG